MVRRLSLVQWRNGPRGVEVEWDANTFRRRFGRLGALGSWRSEPEVEDSENELRVSRQIKRLISKGYWPGHHDLDMFVGIEAEPEAIEGYLVYSDWLAQFDDPRAALIQQQCAGETGAALLEQEPFALLPPVWNQTMELEWRFGFVWRVRFEFFVAIYVEALRQEWRFLRKHPSGRLVQCVRFKGQRPIWGPTPRRLFGERLERAPGEYELRRNPANRLWRFMEIRNGQADLLVDYIPEC